MDLQIESSKNEFKKSSYLEQTPSISSDKQQNEILLPQPNSHGFSKGLTLLQILPIIYALMLIAQTIILIITLQTWLKITISIIFSVLTLLLIIFWFLTTKIDPTDQTQLQHRKALLKKQQFNLPNCKYYCNICQTYVGKQSFHCKKCNRCVQMFDHHCKWLNNCIGAKNYLQFFALVCTIQLSLLFNLLFNSVKMGMTIYNREDVTWYFYLQISFICTDGVILCFNSVLFVMHLYLIFNKKTTLQLILQRRKVNRIYPSVQVNIFKKQTEEHISNIQSNFNQSVNQQKTQKIKIARNYAKEKAKSENSSRNNTPNPNIYSRKKSKTLIVKMNSIA